VSVKQSEKKGGPTTVLSSQEKKKLVGVSAGPCAGRKKGGGGLLRLCFGPLDQGEENNPTSAEFGRRGGKTPPRELRDKIGGANSHEEGGRRRSRGRSSPFPLKSLRMEKRSICKFRNPLNQKEKGEEKGYQNGTFQTSLKKRESSRLLESREKGKRGKRSGYPIRK